MSPKVQPAEVWNALMTVPAFTSQGPEMLEALRPYVEATPTILADQLDEPVTVESLLKATVQFLQYGLANGLVDATINAMPESVRGMFDNLHEQIQDALDTAIEMLSEMVKDVPSMLSEFEITEREFLTNPKVGLSGPALQLYDEGKLTIGELLRLQPEVIIQSQNKG